MRRSKGKTRKYPVRRQQLKQQAQDESSSESAEEDHSLTFLMPSELPSVPKDDMVPNPANEVSPLPTSMPMLMQGELAPAPPDNFGNPSQSHSVPSQDTVVANEMQSDFGHFAPASSGTNETTPPAQGTSEFPVPSVTESDTVEGVANTEQRQKEELPQESLHPQQTRQPPSRLSYYLQVLQCTVSKSALINHQVTQMDLLTMFGQTLIQTTGILSAKTFNKSTWTIYIRDMEGTGNSTMVIIITACYHTILPASIITPEV